MVRASSMSARSSGRGRGQEWGGERRAAEWKGRRRAGATAFACSMLLMALPMTDGVSTVSVGRPLTFSCDRKPPVGKL